MKILKALLLSNVLTIFDGHAEPVSVINRNILGDILPGQFDNKDIYQTNQKDEQPIQEGVFTGLKKEIGDKMPETTRYVINFIDKYKLTPTELSRKRLSNDPKHPDLRLNLYEAKDELPSNASLLVYHALNNMLTATTGYLYDLRQKLEQNKEVKQLLISARKNLEGSIIGKAQKFDDSNYSSKYLEILTDLGETAKLLSKTAIDQDFVTFIESAKKILELGVVRYNTQKALNDARAKLLAFQGNMYTSSVSVSINVPIPVEGMPVPGLTPSVNFSFSKSTTGVGTQTSMFTVTKTNTAKAGATISIAPVTVSGKGELDVMMAAVFYSLEAYMDYLSNGKTIPDFGDLQARLVGMEEHLKNRLAMQKLEEENIARTALFESYLKLFGVSPDFGVSLEWASKTESHGAIRTQEFAGGLELGASLNAVAAKLGFTLKGLLSLKQYLKDVPVINLLNEDCSTFNGLNISDLIEIVGPQYSFDDQAKFYPSDFLGHLRDYVFAISLSDNNKYARDKKHILEKQVFRCKNGRNHVLRSAIIAAAKLKRQAQANEDADIFYKIYAELTKLAKLCAFSKNNSGIRSVIGHRTKDSNIESATAKKATLLAQFSTALNVVNQNIVVDAKLESIAGSPVFEENGKFLTLTFTLPCASTGTLAMNVLRHWFGGVFKKTKGLDIADLHDFQSVAKAFSFGALGSTASGVLSTAGLPIGVSLVGSSQFMFIWKYHDSLKNYDGIVNVPGLDLVKKEGGSWVFDWMAVISYLTGSASLKSNLVDLPLTLQASASYDKLAKRTGVNTYHDIRAKFNILSLGKTDNAYDTRIIDGGLSGQSGQILKIFKNTLRPGSNAAFEIQMLYNALLKTCKNEQEKANITKLFTDYINALKDIFGKEKLTQMTPEEESGSAEIDEISQDVSAPNNTAKVEKAKKSSKRITADNVDKEKFQVAFDLLKEIFTIQYIKLFKPYWDKTFKIKKSGKIDEKKIQQEQRNIDLDMTKKGKMENSVLDRIMNESTNSRVI